MNCVWPFADAMLPLRRRLTGGLSQLCRDLFAQQLARLVELANSFVLAVFSASPLFSAGRRVVARIISTLPLSFGS